MRVSGLWVVGLVVAGCAGKDLPPEPPCRSEGKTDPEHVCVLPSRMPGPRAFEATLGGLDGDETELIAAYRTVAVKAERRHQGVTPWNLRAHVDPCQVRYMLDRYHREGEPWPEAPAPDSDYYTTVSMLPDAERAALRAELLEAFRRLRAHYAERLRLDLEVEDLYRFWLRSLDLIAVTQHVLQEIERDRFAEDPGGHGEFSQRLYNRYELPLRHGHRAVSQALEREGSSGRLELETFGRGVEALDVALTCPLLPGEPQPDVTVRLAAVRRRLQMQAADPGEPTRRAGDEALDAALQATIDAERARAGADRIDALHDELEAKYPRASEVDGDVPGDAGVDRPRRVD